VPVQRGGDDSQKVTVRKHVLQLRVVAMIRGILASSIVLVGVSLLAHATTIQNEVVTPGSVVPEVAPKQFSCPSKRITLSREKLEEIALEDYGKHGGTKPRDAMEFTISNKGCDWAVLITLLPRTPGGHFGVVIDGTTGKVKDRSRGL